MTLQQLEYVIALDTCRHFVTAAEKCFVTQPTLTMQIKKLEDDMGIKIFNRDKKPLQPTREGEMIIDHAYRIMKEVNKIREYVKYRREDIRGEFRMGVIPSLAPYILPLFLNEFINYYPETQLKVYEMQTAEIIASLRSDALDLGLLITPLLERDIQEIPLFDEPFLLYLPQGHELCSRNEITQDMLNPSKMLILTEGHCFRNQLLNICGEKAMGTRSFFYESGSIETLKRFVDKGVGYTLVPALSMNEPIDSVRVKRFVHPQPVREVSLVSSYSFTRHALKNKLANCIRACITDELKVLKPGRKISIQPASFK
jgi:LysR family transcriptional regulator, hydrogen peroxide-inducible genes activator